MTERLVISSAQKDPNQNINEVFQQLAQLLYGLNSDQTKVLTPLPICRDNFKNLSSTNNHFVVLPTHFRTNDHENFKYINRIIHVIEVYLQRRFVIKFIDPVDDDDDDDDDESEVDNEVEQPADSAVDETEAAEASSNGVRRGETIDCDEPDNDDQADQEDDRDDSTLNNALLIRANNGGNESQPVVEIPPEAYNCDFGQALRARNAADNES